MVIKNAIRALALISIVFTSSSLCANQTPLNLVSTTQLTTIEKLVLEQKYHAIKIQSSILGEERELLVHLPDDYENSAKQYPVVYLLDGSRHLSHAIVAENILQSESLTPSSIIIAIKNNQGTRRRDLTSEKNKFLDFIESEVLPLISKQYRVSSLKTLFGHSLAGAFTMDVLARRPALFNNYIAASPVIQIDNATLINQFEKLKFPKNMSEKSLFLSFGHESAEGKSAADAFNQFVDMMSSRSIEGLNWHHQSLSNQVHMTTPYLTFYAGLTQVFNDYQPFQYSGLHDFEKHNGMKGLKQYYEARALKYSVSAEIPEQALRTLGFAIFDDGHESKGLEILAMNVKNHPNSLRAINALAQVYEDANRPEKALTVYRQGLKLAKEKSSSNSAYFQRQVDKLSVSKR